jgi:hypothetical protein
MGRPRYRVRRETHAVAQVLAVNLFNASDLVYVRRHRRPGDHLRRDRAVDRLLLPGDSLLFWPDRRLTAGVEALPGRQLNIWALLILAPICAIAGAQLGHYPPGWAPDAAQAQLKIFAGVRTRPSTTSMRLVGGDPGPLHPDRADVPHPVAGAG